MPARNRIVPPFVGSIGYPSTQFFNLPVTQNVTLAPTPGTINNAAMAVYGRINVAQDGPLDAIHLHLDVDGGSGQFDLEVYRRRSGVHTLIATVTAAQGSGDDAFFLFSFVSDALKAVLRGDYLRLQATDRQTGLPIGFVDVHFGLTSL